MITVTLYARFLPRFLRIGFLSFDLYFYYSLIVVYFAGLSPERLLVYIKIRELFKHFRRQGQRSEYDKGRFWPNLRNCLNRYSIKHNH